ncbi:PREDICTED: leukotriene A-4 hydrolase [Dinoponera quadriceps]|uniref:Leukotriene A(4) hydrolase n=1 Tax=Dinoponera quadriceps TaxID=609295 RepID=A0A6P3X8C0_DINQU|nr:PREDICTED: leukotriene A-4 hydrolase [Dinoponera quadriceps]XP_014474505.1 PREDICTED: leukotriene A-4 hydrolase [Dinoponera quadriceps]
MALSPGDPSSFSRPELAVVTHTYLELDVNFERKVLTGKATLDVEIKGDTIELILDNRKLVILNITNAVDGSQLQYDIGEDVEFGSKLTIQLLLVTTTLAVGNNNKKYKIEIKYETSPDATALQWLTAEQTAGGVHPYLFSQCQAIHARSMFPCQDTPFVKSTYSAKISVPRELTVVMSALLDKVSDLDNSKKLYEFHQPVQIPSYLVAIAIGALVSKQVGPRSKVWAEKELIDKSAYEFGETETMLQTAEQLCGPYVWGIYDILVLPPSFPFGGMENPCLTFVTPTVLAGDRSLANVIAHEISHSWTGNLVTNANFEHFWLNEGFTVFIERKINSKMFGEKMRHFEALHGIESLREEVKNLGKTNQLTNLLPNLVGVDPDDAFSIVPYEKGHTFLFYLEQLLGGPEVFEPFLKSYLDMYKYKSIKTDTWKDYLYHYFPDKVELLNSVDWHTWLHKPGMPPVIPDYDKTLANVSIELAKRWIEWDENTAMTFAVTDIESFFPGQKVAFLTNLHKSSTVLSLNKIQRMADIYQLDSVKNCEIRFIWLRLCIKSRWESKVSEALAFVTEQGRMKYVRPIFRDLYEWQEMRQRAIDVYLSKKNKMMYVTAHMVAKDLHLID